MKLSLISIVSTLILLAKSNNAFQSSSSSSRPYASQSSFSESILTTTQRKSLSLPSWNRRPPSPKRQKSSTTTTTTQLEVSPLTAVTSSPLGAISVLAGIVVVHEAGHYLAARSFNISVDEFSIGFGPKLVGFEALGNEFNLRALPLGGFVRFPENYDIELAEKMSREAVKAFEKRREEEEWTAKENLLYTITFGQWDERRRKERKALRVEQAEEEWKKRQWWQKIGRKQKNTPDQDNDDPEDYEIQYYDDPNLLQNRPWTERAIVLSMGVIFNLILSFLIYFGQIGPMGKGLPQPIFDSGVMVSQVPTRNGPSDGMLNKGDVIVGINGNIVSMAKDSGVVGAQKQVSNVISTIRETKDGESVTLKVIREGKTTPENLEITPKRNGQASPQAIGVFLSPNYLKTEKLQSDDLVEAARLSFRYFSGIVSQTADGFGSFFKTIVSGKGAPPGQQLSGPVGLLKSGTEVVSTQDITTVLLFAAALSVNLGVVNALPLPALDGGQLLFVLAEAITGRKIDQRVQEGLTSLAVLFLFLVTISTTFSDIGNILSGK